MDHSLRNDTDPKDALMQIVGGIVNVLALPYPLSTISFKNTSFLGASWCLNASAVTLISPP